MKQSGQTKKIIGIDYSLTSPAICVADESFEFSKCEFYYLTSKKKHLGKIHKNITGDEHKEYNDPIQRFKNISEWSLRHINTLPNVCGELAIFIEGYSYGSKGQAIFQIAENCGILKYRLSECKLTYDLIVPSVVKKMATGKGNADKEKMYEQFKKDTKVDLMKIFDMNKLNNPVTDIIDSYYIAKSGYESIKINKKV
jgi:Holliday junction resolvasome RuvABC endonuclease subunit